MDDLTLLIPILGIIFSFAAPILLVAVILRYKMRRHAAVQETVLKLAERGLPVPSELLQPVERAKSPLADLRLGLIFVGVGLALGALMHEVNGIGSVALIPLFIGAAYLITWFVGRKTPPAA
jgi:hypothetical protein